MLRSLWLLSTVLAAEALASSGTIDAREAFELVLPDGGSSGTTALSFLLPLPGEDRAIVSDFDVGFVPEYSAKSLAQYLDAGYPYRARIRRILPGRVSPILIVSADIYPPDTFVEGLHRSSGGWPMALAFAPATPLIDSRTAPRKRSDTVARMVLFAAVAVLAAVVLLSI